MINAVIYFVSVAAVVFFFIVKPVQAVNARRAGRRGARGHAGPSDEAVLLTEIRDLLRRGRTDPARWLPRVRDGGPRIRRSHHAD